MAYRFVPDKDGTRSRLKLSDHQNDKREAGIGDDSEQMPVEFFDPWDRKLSFDRQSNVLSPVRREEHGQTG